MGRIKFYSKDDFSCGYQLSNSIDKLIKYETMSLQEIDDLIEIYNIKKFFDHEIYLAEWSKEDIILYKNLIKKLYSNVAKYFNCITDANIISELEKIKDMKYQKDFWELVELFKVYSEISHEKFEEIMKNPNFYLYNIIIYKKITYHFGVSIKNYMLSHPNTAELLLYEYEMKHSDLRNKYFFPNELTIIDKELIINSYIDCKEPNLNYLRLISSIQSNPDRIQVSSKTIVKARRKDKKMSLKLFSNNIGLSYSISVCFIENLEDELNSTYSNTCIKEEYNINWIKQNLDFATLLNNYIYLFNFVDNQMRFTQISKKNDLGILESTIFVSSKYSYIKGVAFDIKNMLSLLQISAYYNELVNLNIRMEEIIEWFFREYLKTEFDIEKFRIKMSSQSTTYQEKCTLIMPALEGVLKQFAILVQDGKIDFELMDVSSSHLIYGDIPSFIKRKYVYGKGKLFDLASFYFFSEQSGLGYHTKNMTPYGNFYELLLAGKFELNDFEKYNLKQINWLLENKFIIVNNNIVEFNDENEIRILKDLYYNEVGSYWKYSEKERICIDYMETLGLVELKSSLFSKPEAEYINYLLNKSQFNNGLDLRNIYLHSQPYDNEGQRLHEQNYMIFLRLFILTIIKINDDLCIFNKFNKMDII